MSNHRVKILFIEDDESNRVTMEALLEDEGFAVDSLDNVQDAKTTIEQHQYDIVIMDWNIGSQCASEILEYLRFMQPHLRIIVATGDPESVHDIDNSIFAVFRKGDPFPLLLSSLQSPDSLLPSPLP